MNLRFLKSFPKYALVLAVLVISTGLFAGWWFFRKSDFWKRWREGEAARRAEVERSAATLPQKMGSLALVGRDLYDINTGELIFKNWLNGIPQRMFYQPGNNKLMVLAERGVIRFALNGSQDGAVGADAPPVYTHDGKQAMFVKNGDVWVAEMDWGEFKYKNPRQATKYGQFNAQFFAANIMTATEKALIVRNGNQQLRVDLLTGNVKPGKAPIGDIAKRRSPDGKFLIGDDGTNVYAYDVDANKSQNFPKGMDHAGDFQWLGNDRCAILLGGTKVAIFDRNAGTMKSITSLPFECEQIAAPSPEGGFVLCNSRRGVAIVSTRTGKAQTFPPSNTYYFWAAEGTLLCSRDVPDTSKRGTWLISVGTGEKLILAEPYTFGRDGRASAALMPELGVVVFSTKNAILRMKPDGSELQEVAKLARPAGTIQAVENWGSWPK